MTGSDDETQCATTWATAANAVDDMNAVLAPRH